MYYFAYYYGYSLCLLNAHWWIRRKSKSNNTSGDSIHILLYLLSHKQVKLLIQVFKRNGFREINNLFNMKYVFLIVFFMILIAIKVMRY